MSLSDVVKIQTFVVRQCKSCGVLFGPVVACPVCGYGEYWMFRVVGDLIADKEG